MPLKSIIALVVTVLASSIPFLVPLLSSQAATTIGLVLAGIVQVATTYAAATAPAPGQLGGGK